WNLSALNGSATSSQVRTSSASSRENSRPPPGPTAPSALAAGGRHLASPGAGAGPPFAAQAGTAVRPARADAEGPQAGDGGLEAAVLRHFRGGAAPPPLPRGAGVPRAESARGCTAGAAGGAARQAERAGGGGLPHGPGPGDPRPARAAAAQGP